MAVIAHLMRQLQADQGEAPKWVHLLPAGTFQGRDGRGPFSIDDAKALLAASQDPGLDMVIDYDHQTDYAAVPKVGGVAPAAGWVRGFDIRDDGIWAHVDWTPKAAAMIVAREYRYISPVFAADKKTGKVARLLRAALTNTPNLPITSINRSTPNGDTSMDELLKSLQAALGLGDDADAEAVVKAATDLKASSVAIAAAIEPMAAQLKVTGDDAKDGAKVVTMAAARLKETGEGLVKVAAAAGAKADADLETIVASVEKAAGNPDPSKFMPASMVEDLQKQVNTLMGDRTTAAVNAAINAGKITPAQKEWAILYASQDAAGFEAFVAAAPVLIPKGGSTTVQLASAVTGKHGLTDEQLQVCAQMNLDPEVYAKTLAEEKETA
ncbi:MAG: phage protease [Alphaproteobacteria bacterium]|nr:phage protease [Alphaproteobacteria bacterium]